MKVRIVKAKHESLWYADEIGREIEVKEFEENKFRCVNIDYFIYKEDCVMIEVDKKWKKGDLLIFIGNQNYTVIYTGKNKKDEDLFEGVVLSVTKNEMVEIGNYSKHFNKTLFYKNV